MQELDVIIIGAGPAGCSTALSLERQDPTKHIRALVIDNSDDHTFKIGESLPASARRSLAVLQSSLLSRLTNDTANARHEVCTGNASAWASSRLDETYAITNMYGMGWHLDRARFDKMLREACNTVLHQGKFVGVRRFGDEAHSDLAFGWEIDVESKEEPGKIETFRTRWLVDATGRSASVARKIGATVQKHHDLLAFYVVLDKIDPDTSGDDDRRTLIEACRSGWWYSSRVPDGKRVLVYTTSPSDPSARIARKVSGFMDMAIGQTTHISRVLGDESSPLYELPSGTVTRSTASGSSVTRPYAAWEPSKSFHDTSIASREYDAYGRGWCAVGDAALAFDALSSQGMITALDAGAVVGSAIAHHLTSKEDKGIRTHLMDGEAAVSAIRNSYERIRNKYETGRAYFYSLVRRFDEGEGTGEGHGEFWASQRV